MREQTSVLEVPNLARRRTTSHDDIRLRRFSGAAFWAAWERAKEERREQRRAGRSVPLLRVADVQAAAGGVSSSNLYNWRDGKGQPDIDQALALAALFGCDLIDFTA